MNTHFRFLLPLVAVSLFGFGCIQVAPRITQAPEAPATAPASSAAAFAYVHLNGDGKANITRGTDTKSAVENAEVDGGDRVRVTNGTVSLVYTGAGETRLSNGTDMTIVADPKSSGLFAELRLASGEAWTRFERLLGTNEHFSVAANGVVATVRGTAFGVKVVGDGADVQVADHQVDVQSVDGKAMMTKIVHVVAGQGIRVSAQQFLTMEMTGLDAMKRTLSSVERNAAGFMFGSQPINAARLSAPSAPVQLFTTQASISPNDEQRMNELQDANTQVQIQTQTQFFVSPSRGVNTNEQAPNGGTPSVKGPAAQ